MTPSHVSRRAWLSAFLASPWAARAALAPRAAPRETAAHPRLYCTAAELPGLRARAGDAAYARLWQNLAESAAWCLGKTPRNAWIAPETDDPDYENLYDRFYAMMQDMAITEHLGFAHALLGEERYADAARAWTLACARAWRPDAEAEPDGGKAYAVMRLLKGTATGYDLVYDRLSTVERDEIRQMIAATAGNYVTRYFSDPTRSGPGFHTHHAIVEYASLGIAALAVLGEVPQAEAWLAEVARKFEADLLPRGLAADGAQVEGATFWASTMHYRLMFMDALRRVTGKDLFTPFRAQMNADLALASVAAEHRAGWDHAHQSVALSPSYGQLNYYAPALTGLAREYRDPALQWLASWDTTLGSLQQTRYITPNRKEQLLFEFGGYACLWHDPSLPADAAGAPRSFVFPSVMQAYARAGFAPGGLLAAVDKGGALVVHGGGAALLIFPPLAPESSAVPTLEETGDRARITWEEATASLAVELLRPGLLTLRWRGLTAEWISWGHHAPRLLDGILSWPGGTTLRALKGTIAAVRPYAYAPLHAVGNGKLRLHDPAPQRYPEVAFKPTPDGLLTLEIETR